MHQVVVGALVRDGRVLLVHRRPDKRANPGVWDLPGGVMEPGDATNSWRRCSKAPFESAALTWCVIPVILEHMFASTGSSGRGEATRTQTAVATSLLLRAWPGVCHS
ncbi:NUDIX hydrolase, partial [Nocardioides flavus (ex Wang et al. 2016)]